MAITTIQSGKPIPQVKDVKIAPKDKVVSAVPEQIETPTTTAVTGLKEGEKKGGFLTGTYAPYIAVITAVALIAVIIVFGKKVKFLAD